MAVYKARYIKNWDADTPSSEDGPWIPARPYYEWDVVDRVRAAWNVLTGKYDALDWEDKR